MDKRLSDLCDLVVDQVEPALVPGALYVGLEHIESGAFTRTSGGRAADVQSTKSSFRKNDVLYGKLRPYLDKAIVADADGVCSTELLVLRAKREFDPSLLVALLHTPVFVEHAISGTTGVQHPRTSWAHIRNFSWQLPASGGPESIASHVWSIYRALEAQKSVISAARTLKEATLRNVFSHGLRGEALKNTEIGPIPKSWGVVPLGSFGRIGNGSTPKKTNRPYWINGTYPWLTSAKVYDRCITQADQFVSDVALRECHLPRVKAGSLVIAITGQGKTLGNCALLGIEATISQHLAYVDFVSSDIIPAFVRQYLETRYQELRQIAQGGGSTKGALTCAFLRAYPIPLPPKDEQAEITEILNTIDRKIDVHQRKRASLNDLFRTLLHKLTTSDAQVTDLDRPNNLAVAPVAIPSNLEMTR